MLRHYKTDLQFQQELNSGIIDKVNDIVFISETKKIYTHSNFYEGIDESILNRLNKSRDASIFGNLEGGNYPVIGISNGFGKSTESNSTDSVIIIGNTELYLNKKFNKLVLNIVNPGKIRLSIFNKSIINTNASPTENFVEDVLVFDSCKYTGLKTFELDKDFIITDDYCLGYWNNTKYAQVSVEDNNTFINYLKEGTNISQSLPGKMGIALYEKTDISSVIWGRLFEDSIPSTPVVSDPGEDPDPGVEDEPNDLYDIPMNQEGTLKGKEILGMRMNISMPGEISVTTLSKPGGNGVVGDLSYKFKINNVGLTYIQFPNPFKVPEDKWLAIHFGSSSNRIWYSIKGSPWDGKNSLGGYYRVNKADLSSGSGDGMREEYNSNIGIEFIEKGNTSTLIGKTFDVIGFSESSFIGDTFYDNSINCLYGTDTGHNVNNSEAMWYHVLEKNTGMKMRYNFSDGNKYTVSQKTNKLAEDFSSLDNSTSPDFVIILFNSSDFDNSTTLGNFGDIKNSDGFYGSVYEFLDTIRNYYPSSRLVVAYPCMKFPSLQNSLTLVQGSYIKSVKENCEFLYYIDFINNSNFQNIYKYTEEIAGNTVFTASGQELIGKSIGMYLENI